MGATLSQFFPPTPSLTESNLPSQQGRTFLITGGYSGVGLELSKILYSAGGNVYIAGRSETSARATIEEIKAGAKNVERVGDLSFLYLDLSDLSAIKGSATEFLAKEERLDVLFNNAGVSQPPGGSVSKQGHELQMATNCLGPFLFTSLLLPVLRKTAASSNTSEGSVRIVWTSSQVVDLSAPTGGLVMQELDTPPKDNVRNYVNSKTGNWFLASEFGKQMKNNGILSLVQNPGNLKTNLMRNKLWMMYMSYPLLYPGKLGAYTALWAGVSHELNLGDSGGYGLSPKSTLAFMPLSHVTLIPWGRKHPGPRVDLLDALKTIEEAGTGRANEFWKWCVAKTVDYS
ncbi:hypothetical protein HYFRA_00012264 [Hymenoscyphus fraxineus]|uniref:Short-chain dehydrogenase n=1 Tax=Hymenoscyphus fraxineus TaxID=746836 RepID=A0A9N9PUY8_9HELO|nr:hypothetical protein HYFRA_00012264 [Hymenoscyphus fraxineus]